MKRQRALELLTQSKPELQARFGVTRLALFGSTVRVSEDPFASFARTLEVLEAIVRK